MPTLPYIGLRHHLRDVPEVHESRDYADRLLRIGAINPESNSIARVLGGLYLAASLAIALVSPPLFAIHGAPAQSGGSPDFLAIVMVMLVFVSAVISVLLFQLNTLMFVLRMRNWRKRLATREIALHLALTPGGGAMIAAAVAFEWRRYALFYLVPMLALTLAAAFMMAFLSREFSPPTAQGPTPAEAFLVGVITVSLMVLGAMTYAVFAATVIGNKTSLNWALLAIITLMVGFNPGPQFLPGPALVQWTLSLIAPVTGLLLAWWIMINHLRNAPAHFLAKLSLESQRGRQEG